MEQTSKTVTNLDQLTTLRPSEFETAGAFVARVRSLYAQIQATGEILSENFQIALVLSRLPEDYYSLRVSMTHSSDLSWTIFQERLSHVMGQANRQSGSVAMGMVARHERGRHDNRRCYKCGKMGHIAQNGSLPAKTNLHR